MDSEGGQPDEPCVVEGIHQQGHRRGELLGAQPIDLVVCNLYPFEQTVAKEGARHQDIVENIDIGGPAMVRSAAKNFESVGVVTSADQYAMVLERLEAGGGNVQES